ncbi:hypothetical protein WN51_03884 [Melipona quadrifasciata]|uniref:Uncharacterized protein n=1 Tax=Melipona quadrifasciata TaxID=166423 RepID=A0A0N0BCA0_9HYME|nr:hypothetical protein WN51_03884 [Melipona quadrifasciata]
MRGIASSWANKNACILRSELVHQAGMNTHSGAALAPCDLHLPQFPMSRSWTNRIPSVD